MIWNNETTIGLDTILGNIYGYIFRGWLELVKTCSFKQNSEFTILVNVEIMLT